MNLNNKNQEGLVIPVSGIVLLPGMTYTLQLHRISEEELEHLSKIEQANLSELKEDDFHKVGVAFDVDEVEKTEKGYQVKITVLDRVEIKSLSILGHSVRATFESAPDVLDLPEKSQQEMLEYLKKIVRELSEHFRGSEQFMKPVDEQKDLNKLMGYLSQFMPLSSEERYDLIQIQSLKERSLKFTDYLLKQKEALKLQLEMTERLAE
ncbi:MAG: endopeptidase La, partial [Clostridia bacterium]|nr:endopeptidase La [Clostridia bacterium]